MGQLHGKTDVDRAAQAASHSFGFAKLGMNEKTLFGASFIALATGGLVFSVRAAILDQWGRQFGYTQTELGAIAGAGLWGFPFTIIALSFVVDRLGYGPLMLLTFLLHILSAIVTLAATPLFHVYGKEATFNCLHAGTFLFALANGACEAVVNPLTATLYPRAKTHWLHILHAGWPGGMIFGALLGLLFQVIGKVRWEIQLGMFLAPTLTYGVMMLGRTFPRSETSFAGVSVGAMALEFASPLLLLLVLLHAMAGYVELGTDSWIINLTEVILNSKDKALLAFIWPNVLVFCLRFCAGPIVHRISPLGLLFCSSVLGAAGLALLGRFSTTWAWMGALTIYGISKSFFWPTMLGVLSERFPRGGALMLGVVGGVGALSGGLVGVPGIGYEQDYFAKRYLKQEAPAAYERYAAATPKGFLVFPAIQGLDNAKVTTLLGTPGENNGNGETLQMDKNNLERSGRKLSDDKALEKLNIWWQVAKEHAAVDEGPIKEARLYGGKMALLCSAAIPVTMAIGHLILILYFRTIGGYKTRVLTGQTTDNEKFTGGVEGPADL